MADIEFSAELSIESARAIANLHRQLDKVDKHTVNVDANTKKLITDVRRAVAAAKTTVKVDADTAAARAKIAAIRGKDVKVRVDVDASNASQAGSRLGDAITRDATGRLRDSRGKFVAEGDRAGDGYGGGFSRNARKRLQNDMKGITQLVAFTPSPQIPAYFGLIAAAAIPASSAILSLVGSMGLAASSAAALAPAMFGAANAIGTMVAALSGPISAFKAFNAMQDQAGSSAASSASSQKASAKAIEGAYEAVADARKRQSREMEDANERLVAANKRVVKAVDAVKNAEKALTAAREEAQRQIEDLAGAARDSANQQEAAAIRLQRAQAKVDYFKQFEGMRLTADMALELREARLELAEAEADVADSNLNASRSQLDYNRAIKAGINGSREVVGAQESIRDAVESLREAQADQARTQRDVARAQEDAAIAVARAIKGVADAQTSAADSAGAASAATSKYQQELAKLSPAGREFLATLIDFSKELDKTKRVAETATLPGFTKALKSLKGLMPTINGYIDGMGRQISRAAENVGKLTETDLFRGRLNVIMGENQKAATSFADSLVPLTNILMSISAAAAPLVSRFAEAFKNGAENLAQWLRMKEETGELTKFFKEAGDELAKWWRIGKNLVGAFIDVIRAGKADNAEFADGIERWTSALKDWTGSDAGQQKLAEFQRKLRELSQDIVAAIPKVARLAAGIGALTIAIRGLGLVTGIAGLVASLANPVGIAAIAILALGAGIGLLVSRSDTLKEKFGDLWSTIKDSLGPSFEKFKDLVGDVASSVEEALAGALGDFVDMLKNDVVPALQTVTDLLLPALEDAWRRIKTTYDENKDTFDTFGKLLLSLTGSAMIGGIVLLGGALTGTVTIASYVVSAIMSIYDALGRLGGFIKDTVLSIVDRWKTTVSDSFNTVKSAAGSLWSGIKSAFGEGISWVSGKITSFKDTVGKIFGSVKDSISNAFRAVPEKALSGLNAVIKIVNDLTRKISDVPGLGFLKDKRIDPIPLPAFARGGQVQGEGTGTSDSVLAKVSRGEYILRAKAVAALSRRYGKGFLNRMNHFDVVGGDESSGALLRPKFAKGGDVSGALDLLKQYNGRPYVFGGTPPNTDCSGWVGMAWAKALGKNPFQRYFTTESVLGTGGWAPGTVKNGFNINLIHGGPGGGHISGELQGHRFESGGSHGYSAFDGPSASIGSFGAQYHSTDITGSKNDMVKSILSAITGPLRDSLPTMDGWFKDLPKAVFNLAVDGLSRFDFDLFDQGGVLKDGGIGINKSGKPEAVLTNEEYKMFKALVSGGGREQNITLNYHGARPDLDTQMAIKSDLRKIARTVAV